MPEQSPHDAVDELLTLVPTSRCLVCRNEPLAAALEYYMGLKCTGDARAHLPLTTFYRDHGLKERFDGPSARTVREHVASCLRVDPTTGKPRCG